MKRGAPAAWRAGAPEEGASSRQLCFVSKRPRCCCSCCACCALALQLPSAAVDEDARDAGAASGAAAVSQLGAQRLVVGAPDDDVCARRASRVGKVIALSRDVAGRRRSVDRARMRLRRRARGSKPPSARDPACGSAGRNRSRARDVAIDGREVTRDLPQPALFVVEAGDHQGHHLHPESELLRRPDRGENRREVPADHSRRAPRARRVSRRRCPSAVSCRRARGRAAPGRRRRCGNSRTGGRIRTSRR